MDLGELLRNVLDENSDYGGASGVDILAFFNWQAAAEAFLAKVQEAEKAETGEQLEPMRLTTGNDGFPIGD